MMLNPGLRKFALTAHVTPSVGWLGAVASFPATEIAACDTHTDGRVRSGASRSRGEIADVECARDIRADPLRVCSRPG